MFIKPRTARRIKDDTGSTLLAVVGLMAVTAIIGVTVANVSLNALGFTSSTRAGVQSQAAAQSGVSVAVAALKSTAACQATYTKATAPKYSVTLSYTTASTLSAAAVWVPGCPTSAAKYVKFVSIGTAQASGAYGTSSSDTQRVEAIYEYTTTTTAIAATGGASYSYNSGTINNLTLLDGGNLNADIRIRTGSVTCQSGTKVNGSIYLGAGSFSGSGACQVTGSINVSDYVVINTGASVLGSISAHGAVLSSNSRAADIYGTGASGSGGRAVVGSINAGGAVYIDGKVGGSVTSAKQVNGSAGGTSTITPNALISGNLTGAGVFTTWAPRCTSGQTGYDDAGNLCSIQKSLVTGTATHKQTSLANPPAPAMAPWVDYNYVAADWSNRGFNVIVWPNNPDYCTLDGRTSVMAHATALSSYTTPTVIDATACSKLDFSQSGALNLSLKTDIAFIANRIDIGKLTANSNNTTQRKLWFIVPDKTVNGVPDCIANNGVIDIKNYTNIGSTVAALAYTPCTISNSAATWSGQMCGKTVNFDTTITLTFKPVGLPNVDFDTGVVTTTVTASASGLGNRVSIRDLTG